MSGGKGRARQGRAGRASIERYLGRYLRYFRQARQGMAACDGESEMRQCWVDDLG